MRAYYTQSQVDDTSIYRRAVRSCRAHGSLWIYYTLFLESQQSSNEMIEAVWDSAMASISRQHTEEGIRLCMARCDYALRQFRFSQTDPAVV